MFERRLTKDLGAREPTLAPWTEQGIPPERINAVLRALAEAFAWSHQDAFRLRPEDKLWPIYHSYYPQERWWQRMKPDELEMETLVRELQGQAPAGTIIELHPDITLVELVRLVAS